MKQFNPDTQSQAHCLVAQAETRPKPAKELTFLTHGLTKRIKHETLTMAHKAYFFAAGATQKRTLHSRTVLRNMKPQS